MAGIAVVWMVGAMVGANSVDTVGALGIHAARKMKHVKTTGNALLNIMVFLLGFDYTFKRPNVPLHPLGAAVGLKPTLRRKPREP
jgi:hypothetical protein